MRVTVLRSFPFSRDGMGSEQAVAGEIVDLPDGLVEGLVRERFVSAILPEPAPVAAANPAAVEAMPAPKAPVTPAVAPPKPAPALRK